MARLTRSSRNAAAAGRKRKAEIKISCECIHEDAVANDGKLPHGYMKAFVEHNKKIWSWMNRDTMNAAYYHQFNGNLKEGGRVAKKGSEKPPEQVTMTVRAGISSSISDLFGDASGNDTNTCSSPNLDAILLFKGGRPMRSTKEGK